MLLAPDKIVCGRQGGLPCLGCSGRNTERQATRAQAGVLQQAVITAGTAGSLAGIGLSTIYTARDVAMFQRLQANKQKQYREELDDEHEEKSFIFSVASAISFVPLLQFMVRHWSAQCSCGVDYTCWPSQPHD